MCFSNRIVRVFKTVYMIILCVFFSAVDHAGIAFAQSRHFLTAMDILSPDHKTWKRRELEIGPHLLLVAEKSCNAALTQEIKLDGG